MRVPLELDVARLRDAHKKRIEEAKREVPLEEEYKGALAKVEDLIKLIGDLLTTRRVSAAFSQAKTMLYDPEFAETADKLYPYLFPIANQKVTDLRDGMVIDRTKEHRFTFASSVAYDGNLKQETPHADSFFLSVMNNDVSMFEYIRKQLGYCLTGEVSSRCFFIWYGALGSNGKGTVARLLKLIMKKFYVQISKDAAIACERKASAGSCTPHLIPLMNARLAMVSETAADDTISEDLVKTWTGNDPLSVRQLYGEQMEIETQAKLVMQTNNKPGCSGHSAMQDRTHFMPFYARFTPEGKGVGESKSDPELIRRLQSDYLDEVFLWILKGSVEWYKTESLTMPAIAKLETERYFEEIDVVGNWLECSTNNTGNTARADLYKDFKCFCDDNELTLLTANKFYSALINKHYTIGRGGARNVSNLALN